MANVNCLEGMQCPNPDCKSEGPLRIHSTVIVLMDDEGTLEDMSGSEWDDDSICECQECDHSVTIKDFTIKENEAAA